MGCGTEVAVGGGSGVLVGAGGNVAVGVGAGVLVTVGRGVAVAGRGVAVGEDVAVAVGRGVGDIKTGVGDEVGVGVAGIGVTVGGMRVGVGETGVAVAVGVSASTVGRSETNGSAIAEVVAVAGWFPVVAGRSATDGGAAVVGGGGVTIETSVVRSSDAAMSGGTLVAVAEGRGALARSREGMEDATETVGMCTTRAVGVTSPPASAGASTTGWVFPGGSF